MPLAVEEGLEQRLIEVAHLDEVHPDLVGVEVALGGSDVDHTALEVDGHVGEVQGEVALRLEREGGLRLQGRPRLGERDHLEVREHGGAAAGPAVQPDPRVTATIVRGRHGHDGLYSDIPYRPFSFETEGT